MLLHIYTFISTFIKISQQLLYKKSKVLIWILKTLKTLKLMNFHTKKGTIKNFMGQFYIYGLTLIILVEV